MPRSLVRGGEGPPVCLVGNFDDAFGTSTANAIESLGTAMAARFGRDDFRLIEWYPRGGGRRFSEVTLTPVPGTEVEHGTVAIGSGNDALTIRRTTATVRFADPRWARRTETELARLLGEEEIRDLRSFAGMPGDYTPERLFGSTGERLTKASEHTTTASSTYWTRTPRSGPITKAPRKPPAGHKRCTPAIRTRALAVGHGSGPFARQHGTTVGRSHYIAITAFHRSTSTGSFSGADHAARSPGPTAPDA